MNDIICEIDGCQYNDKMRCKLKQPMIDWKIIGDEKFTTCLSANIDTSDQDMKKICDDIGKDGTEVQKEESENDES